MNSNRIATAINHIKDIYQRWLDNSLSSEDTIFEIGDVLEALESVREPDPKKSVREPDPKTPGAD